MNLKNKLALFAVFFFALSSSYAQSLPDFVTLVKQYDASVVNISTTTQRKGAPLSNLNIPELENSPFGELFKRFLERDRGQFAPKREKSASLGSGFIISEDGYILTNNHVVEGADEILVNLDDDNEYTATLIGTDPKTDIALIKINRENGDNTPFPY